MRKLIRNALALGAMSFALFSCTKNEAKEITYSEFKEIAEKALEKECSYTSVTVNGTMNLIGESQIKDHTLKMNGRNIDTNSFDMTDANYLIDVQIAATINDGGAINMFITADNSSEGLKYYKEPLKIEGSDTETSESGQTANGSMLVIYDDYALPTTFDMTTTTGGMTMKMNLTFSYK